MRLQEQPLDTVGSRAAQALAQRVGYWNLRFACPVKSLDIKTIFGYKHRPFYKDRQGKRPRIEAVVETPVYDLTIFKVHFGKLTVKIYSKGERAL